MLLGSSFFSVLEEESFTTGESSRTLSLSSVADIFRNAPDCDRMPTLLHDVKARSVELKSSPGQSIDSIKGYYMKVRSSCQHHTTTLLR
jgi:hypothetical protein